MCSSMQRLALRSTLQKAITTCTLWRLKSKTLEMKFVLKLSLCCLSLVCKPLDFSVIFDFGAESMRFDGSYERVYSE